MIAPQFKKEYDLVKNEYYHQLHILKEEKGLRDVNLFRQKGIWALENVEPKMHVIFGNAKLPETTCIVNLGTWFNCPGRKEEFCERCTECYDKQIEVRFKERTKDRLEHEIFWRSVDAKTFAMELIKKILQHDNAENNNLNKPIIKTKLIRWSEVGDIRNQKDLEKIVEASNIIYNVIGIKSYIYTHNKNLNFDIERPNLTINGSGFMVDNEYRVVENREDEYTILEDIVLKRDCICDCTRCSLCSEKGNRILIEELR